MLERDDIMNGVVQKKPEVVASANVKEVGTGIYDMKPLEVAPGAGSSHSPRVIGKIAPDAVEGNSATGGAEDARKHDIRIAAWNAQRDDYITTAEIRELLHCGATKQLYSLVANNESAALAVLWLDEEDGIRALTLKGADGSMLGATAAKKHKSFANGVPACGWAAGIMCDNPSAKSNPKAPAELSLAWIAYSSHKSTAVSVVKNSAGIRDALEGIDAGGEIANSLIAAAENYIADAIRMVEGTDHEARLAVTEKNLAARYPTLSKAEIQRKAAEVLDTARGIAIDTVMKEAESGLLTLKPEFEREQEAGEAP